MKLEAMKKYLASKITAICICGFILAALAFNAPPTPINWTEMGIEIFLILMVGTFTIFYMSGLVLERRQAEDTTGKHKNSPGMI